MSKSKIAIATLGTVAALGVAALPLTSYATETVNGSVDLYVEISPAIAMTIVGNNDSETLYGDSTNPTHGAVDVFAPSTAASSSIDGHTTPAASTTVASSSYASLLPNSVVNGGSTTGAEGFKSTIMVYTNAAGGYNLHIKDSDSTLALTKIGSAETIPAGTESEGSLTLARGTAAWGYKVDTVSTDGTGYKAITASDVQIKQQSAPTSAESNRKTTVYYGVATASDQATGVYTDTIVYTATTR